jgi:uncharacterized membrane protein
MEATGDPYSEYARIASHTGVPTVLGWANHEGLWRSTDPEPEVGRRVEEIRRFYSTADAQTARSTLERYRVDYVVVGDLERSTYPAASHVESLPFLRKVHEGATSVYRVER